MAIRVFPLQLVGTAPVSLSGATTPAAGKIWTIIGLTVCNRIQSPINFSVFLRMPTNVDTYLADGMPLPVSNNHYPVGNLAKHGIPPTGLLYVKSSIVTSLDALLTVDESDNS